MKILQSLKTLYESFIDKLFPTDIKCLLCGRDLPDNNFFCEKCEEEDIYNEGPRCVKCDTMIKEENLICDDCKNSHRYFEKCYCPLNYNAKVRSAILKFKDDNARFYAKPFAELIYNRIKDENLQIDFIMPVPSHKNVIKRRGYNPPELIAKELALIMHLPVKQALIKNIDTTAQKTLSYQERQDNLRDSITRDRKIDIKGKSILIVDDVITTCATVNACALLLQKSKVVYACAVARTTKDWRTPMTQSQEKDKLGV